MEKHHYITLHIRLLYKAFYPQDFSIPCGEPPYNPDLPLPGKGQPHLHRDSLHVQHVPESFHVASAESYPDYHPYHFLHCREERLPASPASDIVYHQ